MDARPWEPLITARFYRWGQSLSVTVLSDYVVVSVAGWVMPRNLGDRRYARAAEFVCIHIRAGATGRSVRGVQEHTSERIFAAFACKTDGARRLDFFPKFSFRTRHRVPMYSYMMKRFGSNMERPYGKISPQRYDRGRDAGFASAVDVRLFATNAFA